MIEFALFFTSGLLLIVLLSTNFERELRARSAAVSIANEALRAWQITQDGQLAYRAAESAATVFALDSRHWSIVLNDRCSSEAAYRIVATVRGVTERAEGVC